ncbi:hypothetical protein RV11_GL003200 [Enterococcus phoeniculicola]|nr:hypothetical protein RV11_GL003200 [Enterococcus phoeniculicola]
MITAGLLPIPVSKGGAVEHLIENILDKNEIDTQFNIHLVSTFDQKSLELSQKYKNTHVFFVENSSPFKEISLFWKKCLKVATRKLLSKRSIFIEYPEIIEKSKKMLRQNQYEKVVIINYPELVLPLNNLIDGEKILYLHNDNLNELTVRAKKIYESFDKCISVSRFINQRVSTVNVSNDKLKKFIVYNGKDGVEIKNKNKKNSLREQFNFGKDDFIAVYIGRLIEQKGVMFIIEALEFLPEYFKVLIVGGTFYELNKENHYVRNLKKVAKQFGNRVIFTGYQEASLIPSFLSISDVGIVPTLSDEAFAMSALEIQMAGIPLICTNVGGLPEVRNDKTSIMLDINSGNLAQEIARAEHFLSHKNVRDKMGLAAFQFSKEFSAEKQIQGFIDSVMYE